MIGLNPSPALTGAFFAYIPNPAASSEAVYLVINPDIFPRLPLPPLLFKPGIIGGIINTGGGGGGGGLIPGGGGEGGTNPPPPTVNELPPVKRIF